MFRKSRQAQQAIEPGKEAEAKKSRFQIVKLEERIAPNKGGVPNWGRSHHGCGHAC